MALPQIFEACTQIVLTGDRDSDGSLTIAGWSYEEWPEIIEVEGVSFRFIEEEGDRALTGITPENERKPETVRAYYDRCG